VKLVRNAKQRGIRVTAEVTPHHLTLTDEWVLGSLAPPLSSGDARPDATMESASKRKRSKGKPQGEREVYTPAWLDPAHLTPYDTSTRVCPPLRSRKDVDALLEGLKDNTIDAIASDHLPCTSHDKARVYSRAVCGISGTETAFGLTLSLVHQGLIDIMDVVHLLTEGPAHVLGRAPTTLIPGARADLVIFDPEYTWTVDAGRFATPSHNTPMHGQHLKGQVMLTMVGGDIVFRHDAFLPDRRSAPQASRLDGILPDEEE
jgi:dihydroorotase